MFYQNFHYYKSYSSKIANCSTPVLSDNLRYNFQNIANSNEIYREDFQLRNRATFITINFIRNRNILEVIEKTSFSIFAKNAIIFSIASKILKILMEHIQKIYSLESQLLFYYYVSHKKSLYSRSQSKNEFFNIRKVLDPGFVQKILL